MYGVVRRYKIEADRFDEVVRRAEQGLVSLISGGPGFLSYRVLRMDNGDLLSVSMFEDRSQADESTRVVAGWVKENLAQLAPNPPEVIAGEVPVREVNSQEEVRYGVMRRYQVDAKDAQEIARRAHSGFVPILRQVPGFAAYAVLDVGEGTLITLSGFRDQAAADRSTQEAATWVRENLAQLVPNAPEVSRGEVRLSRVADPAREKAQGQAPRG